MRSNAPRSDIIRVHPRFPKPSPFRRSLCSLRSLRLTTPLPFRRTPVVPFAPFRGSGRAVRELSAVVATRRVALRSVHAASTCEPSWTLEPTRTAVKQGTLKRPEGRAPENSHPFAQFASGLRLRLFGSVFIRGLTASTSRPVPPRSAPASCPTCSASRRTRPRR